MATATDPTIEGEAVEVGQDIVPAAAAPVSLFRTDDPVEVIEKATRVANALKDVIQSKQLYKTISGRDHVLVEGWATLGSMLGVTGVVKWSRRIEPTTSYDVTVKHYTGPKNARVVSRTETYKVDGHDWEARVEVVTPDGRVIGAAEAICSRKESTWAKRDDYALKSMAQTRAMSKALRGPLGFVVTLAGYEATPFEEISGDELRRPAPTPVARPARTVTASPAQPTERVATAKQRGMLNGKASDKGLSPEQFAAIILTATGSDAIAFDSEDAAKDWLRRAMDRLPAKAVNPILKAIENAEAGS